MGREISLFSNYHQKENSVTNFCGLILKLLYSENPSSFESVVTSMVTADVDLLVGPSFAQQSKKSNSIPDLAIDQKPFTIFFETKLTDWFYSEQIDRHVNGLNNHNGIKILFLISNFENEDYENRFIHEREQAAKSGVVLQAISFEQFQNTLKSVESSDVFKQHLEEFANYLDRTGLLPRWKTLLEVVNCGNSLPEIQAGAYMCPDRGGAYSHRRAKYFGPYSNKSVKEIYEIDAIVQIDINQTGEAIKYKNADIPDESLFDTAKKHIRQSEFRRIENESVPLQVFILSNGCDTDYRKSSHGGMYQSKKYFYEVVGDCRNSSELAEKLDGKTWD